MRAAARRAAIAASWEVIVGQYEEAMGGCGPALARAAPAYAS